MKLPIAAGLATAAVSLTLYPLFNGGSWFWTSMGAILVVTGASAATIRLRAPLWAGPPIMFLSLALYLTLAFAYNLAWLWIIPTKSSVYMIGMLVTAGFEDIQQFAAPVPASEGVTLLTAGGVGLIAVLVDLFAVRLRQAALAGLPLLALFCVPVEVMPDPIGWPAFVLGAFGYVGLLVADGRERLGQWGRAVLVRRSRASHARTTPDTGRLALSGRRIGVTAVALAIVLPALLPNLTPSPLMSFGVGNGTGPGGSSITIPDAIAELGGQLRQQENATVLTYTSSDDQPRYLRIYSLDIFDGRKWTLSKITAGEEDRVSEGPLPAPPGLAPGAAVKRAETQIAISDDIGPLRFLPLPYPATQVDADGDWRADQNSLMVYSTKDQAAGLSYHVVTGEPEPTPEQLEASVPDPQSDRYLELPPGLDPRVAAMAAQVTAGATSEYQQAMKLQEWFTRTGGFTYSLEAQGSGGRALSRFVLTDRTGYCEQFASAMAVMARMLGIPARVAIGFTGGSKVGDSWMVRTHDAHAWPELYFSGVGWLRFEPTPAGGAGQGTAQVPQYTLPVLPNASPSATPSAGASSGPDDTSGTSGPQVRNPRDFERDLGAAPQIQETGTPITVKIALGLAAALVLALIPAAVRLLVRGRRRRLVASGGIRRGVSAVQAAWTELCDLLIDYGMARNPGESPRALSRRLAERLGGDTRTGPAVIAAITTITSAEERRRYARTAYEPAPKAADLATVKKALASAVSRKRRLAAALTPPSTLMWVRALGEKALDGFDRLENIRPSLRGQRGTADGAEREDRGEVREPTLTGPRS
ncbi:transglutaminase [Planotetraspora thailandica]|uniref:Transglutaminase n=1 Tax=Planotetraspora thailandica TaxID=487172 RepID=A0A8J3XVE4_9ACTN|nr:DUF3488 and transglutaminase-like domain-containing protein [Planotetraspora thailandica]GII53930.1 transglutaminase [Planotetraspora thailandica]